MCDVTSSASLLTSTVQTGQIPQADFVKRWSHAISGIEDPSTRQQLRKDCGVAHTLNCSFWTPAREGWQPRCALECLAVEVFEFHTKGLSFQRDKSGAEWWTQVTKVSAPIEFHWDKDEEIFAQSGRLVHPNLSTVTYLGGLGSPTIVLEKTDAAPGQILSAAVSWPVPRAHLRFNGNLLHGAVPVSFADILSQEPESSLDDYRATFLVNIWLDYRPAACKLFPKRLIHLLKTGPGVHFDISQAAEDQSQEIEMASEVADSRHILEASFGIFFDQKDKNKVVKEHTLRLPLDEKFSSERSGLQVLRFPPNSQARLVPYSSPLGESSTETRTEPPEKKHCCQVDTGIT